MKTNTKKSIKFQELQVKNVLRYFNENNLALYYNWSLTFSAYKVKKLFDKHYFEATKKFCYDSFKKDLIILEKDLNNLYSYYLSTDKDYRTGYETYGYIDEVTIRENLAYINDRWRCAFRIRWLIDLIDLYKKDFNGKI